MIFPIQVKPFNETANNVTSTIDYWQNQQKKKQYVDFLLSVFEIVHDEDSNEIRTDTANV